MKANLTHKRNKNGKEEAFLAPDETIRTCVSCKKQIVEKRQMVLVSDKNYSDELDAYHVSCWFKKKK